MMNKREYLIVILPTKHSFGKFAYVGLDLQTKIRIKETRPNIVVCEKFIREYISYVYVYTAKHNPVEERDPDKHRYKGPAIIRHSSSAEIIQEEYWLLGRILEKETLQNISSGFLEVYS